MFPGGGDGLDTRVDFNLEDYVFALSDLSVARYDMAGATFGNGEVVFGGGYTDEQTSSDVVEKYSLSGVKTTLTPLGNARGCLEAVTFGNGEVVFAGGRTAINVTGLTYVEKYTAAGVRTAMTPLTTGRHNFGAARIGNDAILGGGGGASIIHNSVVRLTSAGVYTSLTNLSTARQDVVAVRNSGGNILFLGGRNTDQYGFLDVVNRYSSAGNMTTISALLHPNSRLVAAADGGGAILAGYGQTSSTDTGNINKYSSSDVRTTIYVGSSSLNTRQGRPGAAAFGEGSVIFGNYLIGSGHPVISTSGGTARMKSLSASGHVFTSVVTDGNGDVLIAGGGGGTNPKKSVYKYVFKSIEQYSQMQLLLPKGTRYKFSSPVTLDGVVVSSPDEVIISADFSRLTIALPAEGYIVFKKGKVESLWRT